MLREKPSAVIITLKIIATIIQKRKKLGDFLNLFLQYKYLDIEESASSFHAKILCKIIIKTAP